MPIEPVLPRTTMRRLVGTAVSSVPRPAVVGTVAPPAPAVVGTAQPLARMSTTKTSEASFGMPEPSGGFEP